MPTSPPLSFLIVDDEADARQQLKQELQDLYPDAEIIESENQDTAEAVLREKKIRILATDMNLTNSNPNGGLHVTRTARELHGGDIIIIAMSSGDRKEKALEAGADWFAFKRKGFAFIARLIRRLLEEQPSRTLSA